jgi:3-hydroxyacyl-CoA dehydrogenase/enoyl-CoA hydratase/3-hydroxybutyryl-CoA epimerase
MSTAFDLAVQPGGLATLTFDLPDKSVNVFTRTVLDELGEVIESLSARRDIRCLVLASGKEDNFVAGADIDEIADVTDPALAEQGARLGQRLFQSWNELPFPTIAAVRGSCVGGGTELSLASDYILISDRKSVRIGLPEVRIGIVPAWGGCSRLPTRIGLTAALDIIVAGKSVDGRRAFKIGLADALLPEPTFLQEAHRFAQEVLQGRPPAKRRRELKSTLLDGNPIGRKVVFSQARKRVLERTGGHYPAALRAIEVVEVGVRHGLEAGLEAEARATGELAVGEVCKSLIHIFKLMEAANRVGTSVESGQPEIREAAVLGAGVMGGGIAQLLADRVDIPVRLKDVGTEPLATGMAHADAIFQKKVKRRRLTRPEAAEKMNLLLPSLDYAGFQRVDLVIEAIVEDLEIKQKVFAEVAARVGSEVILASNTSSLSVDLIGRDTPNPERVVGMHFFNPVHRMPLVEVIEGPKTSPRTVQTVLAVCRRLGKTPVVVQDGPGFLVNRLLTFYMAEALWLLSEGREIEEIDGAMSDWGMPMGPLALIDAVGIDVAVKVSHILSEAFGDRLALPTWVGHLDDPRRLGMKTGSGFYLYKGGERTKPDPEIRRALGLAEPTGSGAPGPLVDRMVLPMVNEAARCLAEQVVRSPSDLDLAMILGTGFPPFRGGLCRWADLQGIEHLVESLARLAEQHGERFSPSEALVQAAEGGGIYPTYS